MVYRPEIDGLRGISILLVILCHAEIGLFSGGFVGVDMFFVISGYLITKNITQEINKGKFNLFNFYERRARRIFPALFFVMFISALFGWLWLMPNDLKNFSQSLLAASTFLSNILFWLETGDYWDPSSSLKPLLHTWSLSVEEQFYLIFPLFMILMLRFRKKYTLRVLTSILVLTLITSEIIIKNHPSAAFYLLPARIWEILVGTIIAIHFNDTENKKYFLTNRTKDIYSFLGFSLIFYSAIFFDETTVFPGFSAVLPTVGAGLIIINSSSNTFTGRILTLKPLVFIGIISYSAYLWHHPIFSFVRYKLYPNPGALFFFILILIIFLISFFTWFFIEKPFRNENISKRGFFIKSSVSAILIFIGLGFSGYYFDGFKSRSVFSDLFQEMYQPENYALQHESWSHLRLLSNDPSYSIINNQYDRENWFSKNDTRKKMLLVGNSHSKDLYNALINSNYAHTNFQIARYGSQISDLAHKDNEFFLSPNYIESDFLTVISRYTENDLLELEDFIKIALKDGKKVVIVRNIFEFDYLSGRTIADNLLQNKHLKMYLNKEISSSKIVIETDKAHFNQFISRPSSEKIRKSNRVIDDIGIRYKDIHIIDRMDFSCNKKSKRCFSLNEKFEKYYYDYGHYTVAGGAFFGKKIDEVKWLDKLLTPVSKNIPHP